VFTLLFALVAAFHTVIPAEAEAASVPFRVKRSWWGGTSVNSPADPCISYDYHPRENGPNKAPPAYELSSTACDLSDTGGDAAHFSKVRVVFSISRSRFDCTMSHRKEE
jgi:hypothetical protein